ncbi:hypothetical protein PsorP6_018894 [Peronosclerospora sorghi]|nr:hypothetical protein PsorP6_018894 [Peronosclerospora sorghi]
MPSSNNDVEDFDAMLEKQFGYVDDEGNIFYIEDALEEEERKEDVGADSHDLPQELRDTKPDEEKAEPLEKDVSDLSANEIKAEEEPPAAPALCKRINPALMIRGSTLYVYGGVLEDGDREITLDDFCSLDIKRLD